MPLRKDSFEKFFPSIASQFNLKDFQTEVIDSVLDAGNTLCLMQTGGGKSLIYWLAGLESDGITMVVSPLIALMGEQAMKLQNQGYEVLELNSKVAGLKQEKALTEFAQGKKNPKFIFVSPEKLGMDGYFEYCLCQRKEDISLVVIDEVHCVSQWGESFRPFYRRIPEFLDEVFSPQGWPRLLAMTATLNPKELEDICAYFKIDKQNIKKDKVLTRTNITLHVKKIANEEEKTEELLNLIDRHKGEKILVYVYRKYNKHGVEDLTTKVTGNGFRCAQFHGDMDAMDRMDVIERFKKGDLDVVVATNAFGMGIDIPDIRVVIHYMIPESTEQYYQEVGRAGRDGLGANAYLLYSDENVKVRGRSYIDKSFPTRKEIAEEYKELTRNTKSIQSFSYLDDDKINKCISYLVDNNCVRILGKGFDSLEGFKAPYPKEFENLFNCTKTHGFISTVKKASEKIRPITHKELANLVFKLMCSEELKSQKPLDKRLIIEGLIDGPIPENKMDDIMKSIEEKKEERHKVLDYFVRLLEQAINSDNASLELHQEIGKYLGADKKGLNLIYTTEDGTKVRSKSEVIISNQFHSAGLNYKYEEPLVIDGIEVHPDFTIHLSNGKTIYWEHVGMLGSDKYDLDWDRKLKAYAKLGPDVPWKTYESCALSQDVAKFIEKLKAM